VVLYVGESILPVVVVQKKEEKFTLFLSLSLEKHIFFKDFLFYFPSPSNWHFFIMGRGEG
jgi:hypothetical protein